MRPHAVIRDPQRRPLDVRLWRHPAKRLLVAGAHRLYARKLGQPRSELLSDAPFQGRVRFTSQARRRSVEMRGLEARVHCLDEPQAAEQKARRNQQHETDRDLRHDQGIPEPRARSATLAFAELIAGARPNRRPAAIETARPKAKMRQSGFRSIVNVSL